MITIEGLDNTGKTTLASQIHEAFPLLLPRPSIGNTHDLEAIGHDAIWEVMGDTDLVLSDRCRLISEYVYNPILRKRDLAITFPTWMGLIERFVQRPQLIIHCTRPLFSVARGWDEDNQLEGVFEHLAELDEAYNRIMVMFSFLLRLNGQPRKVVRYDYELTPWKLIEARIHNYFKEID